MAELCRRLDGIPLALELAAARVRALPVGDLLGLLEDRFRLLTGGSRTALPRQQTLAATVDWSYALLTEAERALFRRLAVFAGGWSLAAAERVAADPADTADAAGAGGAAGGPGLVPADGVLELLTQLVDRSLVLAGEDGGGHARFRLLETLREYALERLRASGEADAVHRRHLAHFTRWPRRPRRSWKARPSGGGSTGWSGSTTTAAPPCAGCWRTPSRRPSTRGCASPARCPGSG